MFTTPRLIAAAVILTLVIASVSWLWQRAEDDVLNQIERQNNEAAQRADESALDYDACRDAERVWDFRSGRCLRTAPGARN